MKKSVVLLIFSIKTVTYICAMEEDVNLTDGRIDISEDGIAYWASKINCDPTDLKYAVSKVGDKYNVIVLFLELNRKIKND